MRHPARAVAELLHLRVVVGEEDVERIDSCRHARRCIRDGAWRSRLTDALDQLQHAEPGQLVARVVEDAQQRQQVADVRGLEEPQPAVLHVGDVAVVELDLEDVGVMGGAEQHRLLRGRSTPSSRRARTESQTAAACAASSSVRRSRARRPPAATVRRCFGMRIARLGQHGVGDGQDRRRRPVVVLERHDRRAREPVGEAADVGGRGRAERVDGLCVVADHGQPRAVGAELGDDVGL